MSAPLMAPPRQPGLITITYELRNACGTIRLRDRDRRNPEGYRLIAPAHRGVFVVYRIEAIVNTLAPDFTFRPEALVIRTGNESLNKAPLLAAGPTRRR